MLNNPRHLPINPETLFFVCIRANKNSRNLEAFVVGT
jgi:hypothetical protein